MALKRIQTGNNISYKNSFRHILNAYSLNAQANLENLRIRLRDGVYEASLPIRAYYPKPSGLQRPITYLNIEDHIVYQALANIFQRKLDERRNALEGIAYYSSWTNSANSEFFLQDWKRGFSKLRNDLLSTFDSGYSWVAKFDLAAYYDTIDHKNLLRLLGPKGGSKELQRNASNWLSIWSSTNKISGNGIPQGPIASIYLGECFLIEIDEIMRSHYKYFRFVDDIRIVSKSKDEIKQASVFLDVLCKEIGLIPQTKKTEIVKVKSGEGILQGLPEIKSYFFDAYSGSMSKEKAESILISSIDSNGKRILDKTQFRYALFSAPKSRKILERTLRLLPKHPEHMDGYTAYFNLYQKSVPIVRRAKELLEARIPYDFVIGELWKILARMGTQDDFSDLMNLAVQTVRSKKKGNWARIGASAFLCRCENEGLGRLSRWAKFDNEISLSFVGPYLDLSSPGGREVVEFFFNLSASDPGLSVISNVFNTSKYADDFGLGEDSNPITVNTYKSINLLEESIEPKVNPIGRFVKKHFNLNTWSDWDHLLLDRHHQALVLLVRSMAEFNSNPSNFLSLIDSFNNIVFDSFQAVLHNRSLPGAAKLTNKNGQTKSYGGQLWDKSFKTTYPNFSKSLGIIHERRNKLPESHPYDQRTGKKTKPLKWGKRFEYKGHQRQVLKNISSECIKLNI